MALTRWDERYFASTRGQVVALLRRGQRTVDDLARALGLTDNAVRAHLAALERDGFVRQTGLRRGAGKPAYTYDLTPDAERLFPKAYGPLLHELLDVLADRQPAAALEADLREVGHRLAAGYGAADGTAGDRVARALAVLADLGGLAEAEERDGLIVIEGQSCPLAAAVPGHPEVCRLAETLLTDVTGLAVVERCIREASPRCRFEVAVAERDDEGAGSPM